MYQTLDISSSCDARVLFSFLAVSLTEGRQSLEYLNKWMRVVRMVQEDLDEDELAYLEHNQKPDTFMPPDVQDVSQLV